MQLMMLLATATVADADATQQGSLMGTVFSFIPLIAIFVIMYFLMIRPQKKKEKKSQEMRNNIQIGDEITTIGGIVGIVVRKTDDADGTIVLETGGDRSKIRIKKWAIQTNDTMHEATEKPSEKA